MHVKLYMLLFGTLVVTNAAMFRKGSRLGGPGGFNTTEEVPPANWFKQKLDHYSATDLRTWKQRYYVNESYFDSKNPGPIFLMIGGEGPADPRWMLKGAWIDYASKFKALCILLEHRYYGSSHPTENLSVKNLQYLSSYQALADLANFIEGMNVKYKLNKDVKWIAFGGSYPGSLAAWLRLKYPHLVHGAISTSGPLLAKVDFSEYFQVVAGALTEKTGNDQCVNQLKLAHQQTVELMKTDPQTVEKEFKVCKPFAGATKNDIKNFYSSIANDFADLVQYNEDNRISGDPKYKNVTINNVCAMLTKDVGAPESETAFKKLAAFNAIILEKENQTCLDYSYDSMIKQLRNMSLNGDEGGRQWMYQTCTEFGFFQTSSAEKELFGDEFTVDFYIQQCQDIFGAKYNKQFLEAVSDWTNNNYGALNISVTRVVFVHGSVDPWHALGITASSDVDTPAIYIRGTAHCANMYPASASDPRALVLARAQIQRHLQTWLI